VCLQELQIDEMSPDTRYVPNDLSVLCPDAVADPVDLTARKSGSAGRRPPRLRGQRRRLDGGSAFRRPENILGWTRMETRGNSGTDKVMRAAVVGNDVYLLVRRTIMASPAGSSRSSYDDAFWTARKRLTSETPQSVWTGFDHLEGETVSVWADGARRDDVIVTAAPSRWPRAAPPFR